MAKPMPMDPAVPEDVVVDAMDELMPITWPIDGRVNLHGVGDDVVVVVIGHGHRAVERGNDADGCGVIVAERVADGHHGFAHGKIVGIGKFRGLQITRRIVELDYGQIGGGVGADDLR